MEENLLQIINHYGVMPQLKYFQSEVFELNEAIINAENYEPNPNATFTNLCCNTNNYIEHIAEEIADVMVMLCQFKEYYKIDGKEIMDIMNQKIDRQLGRIADGE